MDYVTFDASGALTGFYRQELQPEHAGAYIAATFDNPSKWPRYRANAARDGVELAPVVPPAPVVPEEVSRRAGLQQLFLMGITEAMLEAKITQLLPSPQRDLALIELATSQVFKRNRPLVVQIGQAFGIDLDQAFINAAKLP